MSRFDKYVLNPMTDAKEWVHEEIMRISDYLWTFSEEVSREVDDVYTALDDHENAYNPHGKMNWIYPYVFGDTYYPMDTVRDGSYSMVANKETVERAAPQATGDPAWLYDGTLTDQTVSSSQITFGLRGTQSANHAAFIRAYRIYVVSGIHYVVYVVTDATTATPIIEQLRNFTAETTGWLEFNIDSMLVVNANPFDLVVLASEPAATPVTWVGNWDYLKPNNASVPLAGDASHANRELASLRINFIDDDGGDRETELLALTPGDKITVGTTTWSIQVVTDVGTYADFTVVPAAQSAATGVSEFTFETVTATPIPYHDDVDYWLGNDAAQGFFSDTGQYPVAPNQTAYGIDLSIQPAAISLDWNLLATSDTASSDAGVMATSLDVTARMKDTTSHLGAILTRAEIESHISPPYPASFAIREVGAKVFLVFYNEKSDGFYYIEIEKAS